jgi:hypothetical protein
MQVRCLAYFVWFVAIGVFFWESHAAGADWIEHRQAGPFEIRADFALDNHAHLLTELERLEGSLASVLKMGPIVEPVHIILFKSKQSYESYLGRYFNGAPARRALFIKGSQPGWVFAYLNPQFEIDLRHEGTHALLHAQLPMVPLWLDEGLAEYFEVPEPDRANGNPHLKYTKWGALVRRMRSLSELEELSEVRDMGNSEYRAAWAWIHFMIHGPEAAQQVLVQFLSGHS